MKKITLFTALAIASTIISVSAQTKLITSEPKVNVFNDYEFANCGWIYTSILSGNNITLKLYNTCKDHSKNGKVPLCIVKGRLGKPDGKNLPFGGNSKAQPILFGSVWSKNEASKILAGTVWYIRNEKGKDILEMLHNEGDLSKIQAN